MSNNKNYQDIELVTIEIFEIEADEDFFENVNLDEVFDCKSLLNQNEKVINCTLVDSHTIKTPINEGKVLAELVRTLFFVYHSKYSLDSIFGYNLIIYLKETEFQDFTYYRYFPKDYFKRFFILEYEGMPFNEAIREAVENEDVDGIFILKDESFPPTNSFEEAEYGWELRDDYKAAAILNFIISEWDNSNFIEAFHYFYFI